MAKTNPVRNRNVLLDTLVLLWWLDGSSRLSQAARGAIIASEAVYVSSATAWEIGIKASQGKLDFSGDLGEQLSQNDFRPLPISISHAVAAAALPFHHRDPFDRLIVAQAKIGGGKLITRDRRIREHFTDAVW